MLNLHDPGMQQRLETIVQAHSPYLSHLLTAHPGILPQVCNDGVAAPYAELMESLSICNLDETADMLMQRLRVAKGKLALMVALADIAELWKLEEVTGALSAFADRAVALSIDTLLRIAHQRGEILLRDLGLPSQDSGIVVLGMGKLGAGELNYSSDIDLIIFYEPGKIGYKGRHSEQRFMNKLAQELVHVMQERTKDGYVFRTDLRLRPDPASTPPAITIDAAASYYESVGQNWERAAMIKARAIAGDIPAGELFMKNLTPFMWRRSLDFASINDIHSIKRQMDTRQGKDMQMRGHNIKLGMGGIREIEFYVQIHQLIWGGREPTLRARPTCETLMQLAALGRITQDIADALKEAYGFLRKLEHRLQMVADEQTHTLPESDAVIASISAFMGFASVADFEHTLLGYLHRVHDVYASSFKGAEKLGDVGNLVFTGVSHDPDTLETLRKFGYASPETVSEIVMGWHHGSCRATRTKRARELLTELMPALIKRLAETANPDAAFLKFNEFLRNLPAGVQLFSLFQANPQLLGLIADILGSAPSLAERLSKSPSLLDAVISPDFYAALPPVELLLLQLRDAVSLDRDFEEHMDGLRRFRNEKQFHAGVHLLKGLVTAHESGAFLANLADLMVEETLRAVTEEFKRSYGTIAGSHFAVIALGKLGSREMTFSSDIDLVFIYEVPDFEHWSDGEKSFTASVYFNRFAQRFLHALTFLGNDGRLYEVDTRLRPSGKQGLLAVSVRALDHYFTELAWTFEYMAFTKARVVCANSTLGEKLSAFICEQVRKPRDAAKLKTDVCDMRERMEAEFGTKNPWHIKYVRGGLVDLDFIAQYLLLLHAPSTPGAQPGSTRQTIVWLRQNGLLASDIADSLLAADHFLGQIFNMLRLCTDSDFDDRTTPPGLKKLLCQAVGSPDFETLTTQLITIEQDVYRHYIALVAT